jgi:beta-N-acetylhexosaminidase
MKMLKWILVVGFMGFVSATVGWQKPELISDKGMKYELHKSKWIDSVANSLSTEEKIAQFFMAAVYSRNDEAHKAEIMSLITKYNIGGLIFFQGTPGKQAVWANDFQNAAKTPLFVSIDGEWGINMRLDNTIKYPRQLTLGAIKDEQLIYDMGKRIAEECKAVGVNINLAPVMDINNNPKNPVINDRSFGEDKYNVALKSMAYAHGMQDAGVMAVGKHFPGHGDTDKDSHYTLPTINHNLERLKSIEFYPFKVGFQNGLMGVMAAHLHIPALDNTKNLAVSLSPKVTTHWLRDSLGFEGLVFSDALNMKGVSDYFAPGEVDKVAFLAGNDVLLFSVNIPKGIELIKKALEKGEFSEAYLNERLRRVLSYKYDLGLTEKPIVSTVNVEAYLNNAEGKKLQQKLFQEAVTVVNNEEQLIPLAKNKEISTATISIGASGTTSLQKMLTTHRDITHFTAGKDVQPAQISGLAASLAKFDQVIIPVYDMSRFASKNYGFSKAELDLIHAINQKTKVVLVLFGSPYSLIHFSELKNIIVAYEENELTEIAVANVLSGAAGASGKLPVSAGPFKFGQGLELAEKKTLRFGNPETSGFDSKKLDKIDDVAKWAIQIGATPGCQILVAKDGEIVYNKSFGKQKYIHSPRIDADNIYDVASITKIAATTIAVMKLYEEGKIDLNQPVKKYIPAYDTVGVGNLIIKDILAHHSGLPGWIPFYQKTLAESVYNNWYQSDSSEVFCVRVADDLFICKDSTEVIWRTIGGLSIKQNQGYKYSDIGFYLLKRMVVEITGMGFEQYLNQTFYEPMNLHRIGFMPERRFPREKIVPTENDRTFRKQEVLGYVHDPGAAMLGGVSGHAGLFSNAKDLAAIMHMLLNEGEYNGIKFLKKETIDYFNTVHFTDSRRGLGFDKPALKNGSSPTAIEASPKTFGHTGFTGTCAWADPEHNLVYIFLSNRTFPDAENNKLLKENIRTDIHSLIYKAMISE